MDSDAKELLIRIDERQTTMHEKLDTVIEKVEKHDDDIKEAKTHIRIIKWLGGSVTAIGSYLGIA